VKALRESPQHRADQSHDFKKLIESEKMIQELLQRTQHLKKLFDSSSQLTITKASDMSSVIASGSVNTASSLSTHSSNAAILNAPIREPNSELNKSSFQAMPALEFNRPSPSIMESTTLHLDKDIPELSRLLHKLYGFPLPHNVLSSSHSGDSIQKRKASSLRTGDLSENPNDIPSGNNAPNLLHEVSSIGDLCSTCRKEIVRYCRYQVLNRLDRNETVCGHFRLLECDEAKVCLL